MISHVLCLLLFFCSTTISVSPITNTQANGWAAVTGASSALATGLALEHMRVDKPINIGISAVVGILTTLITRSILLQYTPAIKTTKYIDQCASLAKSLSNIEADSLVCNTFSMPDDLLTAVIRRFGTETPLILAQEHLAQQLQYLAKSIDFLEEICTTHKNLSNDPECKDIFQECYKEIETKIKQFDQSIKHVLEQIVQHPQYQKQLIKHRGAEYRTICNDIATKLSVTLSDFLINTKAEDLLVDVTTFFGTSWALVLAREHLQNIASNLTAINNKICLAETAYQKLQEDPLSKDCFDNNCPKMKTDIIELMKKINTQQKVIITHPSYVTHVNLYENNLKHEREMSIKKQEIERQKKLDVMIHQERLKELENQKEILDLKKALEKLNQEIQAAHEKNKQLQSLLDKNKNTYKNEICVICQEKYHTGDSVGILNCGHAYHHNCITTSLQYQKKCPLCRASNARIIKKEVVS